MSWLVLSAIGMVMALLTSQYLYSEAFLRRYPEPASLAAFLGTFLVAANAVELAVELGLTPWLIRRLGVASANVLHPLATLGSFAGLAGGCAGPAIAARLDRDAGHARQYGTLVYNAPRARAAGCAFGRHRGTRNGDRRRRAARVPAAGEPAMCASAAQRRPRRAYLAANSPRRTCLATLVEELAGAST
jgi:hypothetical protein